MNPRVFGGSKAVDLQADGKPKNRILARLPKAEFERIEPHLTRESLPLKQRLLEPNVPIRDVFFPISCVISMITIMRDGTRTEVATVGNEGLVGLPVFLGAKSAPVEAFAQVSGEAWRMPAPAFRRILDEEGKLNAVLRLYTQLLLDQMAQSVSCNRVHPAEQRFCRWMLLVRDQVGRDRFEMTQEFLGQMVGVRRGTVSEVASKLQARGIITYSRGSISIDDPEGMKSASCECYGAIRRELDRLLP